MASSTDVSWQLDGIAMYGSFTRPEGNGPFAAVVLVAGSGPTDRDWNSPLLPGTNGSAKLLAEALAEAGIASLRYDKRGSGPHVMENLPAMIGKISMRSHLDEVAAAVGVLTRQDAVDASRIAGLGNSEGCLHLLHYATSEQEVPLRGLVLTGPPGRAIGELVSSQLTQQLAPLPDGEKLVSLVGAAVERYAAGKPMDLDPRLPEPTRTALSAFEVPANLPFARELWSEDAADSLPEITVPVLVVIGGKDIQVDVHADGGPLQRAAEGHPNVTFAFPEHANHVLKEETRSHAELVAAPSTGYNEPGTRLDPDAVDVILSWLREVIG